MEYKEKLRTQADMSVGTVAGITAMLILICVKLEIKSTDIQATSKNLVDHWIKDEVK